MSYPLVFGLIFATLYHVIYENVGNWSELQAIKQEGREKDKISRETLGKYFYDLSKLSFGAMVLGVIVPWFSKSDNDNYWLLLLIGLFTTISLAYFGYKVIRR